MHNDQIRFPTNSFLNFNYVEFTEAHGENWRNAPYFSTTCDRDLWEIHPKYVMRDAE